MLYSNIGTNKYYSKFWKPITHDNITPVYDIGKFCKKNSRQDQERKM